MLKQLFIRFKRWQKCGRKIPQMDHQVVHKCPNCSTYYVGNFCNCCGQKSIEKFEKGEVTRDLISATTYFDSTLLNTILELLFRPGYMVRDYLRGKRASYTNPFVFLFIAATIYMLFESILGNAAHFNSILLPLIDVEIEKTPEVNWFYSFISSPAIRFIFQNKGMLILLSLPFWVFSLKIAFRSKKLYPTFKTYQWIIIQTYASGMLLIVTSIIMSISIVIPNNIFAVNTLLIYFLAHLFLIGTLIEGKMFLKVCRLILAYIICTVIELTVAFFIYIAITFVYYFFF